MLDGSPLKPPPVCVAEKPTEPAVVGVKVTVAVVLPLGIVMVEAENDPGNPPADGVITSEEGRAVPPVSVYVMVAAAPTLPEVGERTVCTQWHCRPLVTPQS